MNTRDWLRLFDFFIQSKTVRIVVLSLSRLKISDYFLYSIVLFLILYSMSDKKLLLKEIEKKKQSQNTKQVEYYELLETRSFGGERLKIFQK